MMDILASLDREDVGWKWCITFWVTMKRHGEISTYFRLKHHCGKKSDIFTCSVSKQKPVTTRRVTLSIIWPAYEMREYWFITLNSTYKCAHIHGLISSLILARSFSNFQQI